MGWYGVGGRGWIREGRIELLKCLGGGDERGRGEERVRIGGVGREGDWGSLWMRGRREGGRGG